jgi:uncharacterized Zn-binding protein involved in type VI secretion
MSAAARVGDPIEHTSALEGLLLGMALGAAVVVGALAAGVTIAASGGLATIAVIGAVVSISGGIGELIGSLSWCTNKAGQIFKGSGNVFTNGKPAARAHLDTAACEKHGSAPQVIAQGSRTVHINGQPAARVGDRTVCDGKISAGSGNVNIGGPTAQTDDINPEVALWVHVLVAGIGFGSATVLRSFAFALGGLIGGVSGGFGGSILGGRLFGEDSNGQKFMAFAGAWLGGGLGAKGGEWVGARYELQTQGFGSNLANVKIVPKAQVDEVPVSPLTAAGRKAEFFSEEPINWSATRPAGTNNNYEVFQRKDIDWNQVRTAGDKRFIGKSNLEAASKGLPPQLPDGNFATLHHLGQKSPGPLVEGSTRYHGVGKPGQDILHSQYGRSKPHPTLQPDRKKFDVDTREYWKWRIEDGEE